MNGRGGWRALVAQALAALRARLVDETARGMAVVFGGHAARLALGLVSSALLARGLGPAGLNAFSVVGALMMVALTISDFGLSNSAVRQVAGDLEEDTARARRTAGVFARLRLLGALLVFGLVFLLADPLAKLLGLPGPDGLLYVRLGSLGVIATSLSAISGALLRSLGRFSSLTATQMANIGLTIVLLAALTLLGRLDVPLALLVGVGAATLAAALGTFLLPRPWRPSPVPPKEPTRPEALRLLRYSRWLWISAVLSILLAQLDLLLLNRWLGPVAVGMYALALSVSFKAGIVNQTLHTVLLPHVSRLSGRMAYRDHLRRSLLRSGLLSLAILLLLPLARPFILLVYGSAYEPAVGVFYALMSVVIFNLFTIPIQLLAFPLDIPQRIVLSDVVALAVLMLGLVVMVPAWGLYGAAAARLAANVAGFLVIGLAIARAWRRLPETAAHPPSAR
jgi:O-antigen/teichoic acid export membrane protein